MVGAVASALLMEMKSRELLYSYVLGIKEFSTDDGLDKVRDPKLYCRLQVAKEGQAEGSYLPALIPNLTNPPTTNPRQLMFYRTNAAEECLELV
jgi:hypothetical protein